MSSTPRQHEFLLGADINGNGVIGTGSSGCSDPGDSVLAAEVAAVRRVVQVVDPANVRIALIEFESSSRIVLSLTSDFVLVEYWLDQILSWGASGGTDFVDALIDLHAEFNAHGDLANRVPSCFFLSDGEDNRNTGSEILFQTSVAAALGIRVDTFGVGRGADPYMLTEMAAVGGGEFVHLLDPADILDVLPKVVLVGIRAVQVVNLTTGDALVGTPAADGTFTVTLPMQHGFNQIDVVAVADDPYATTVHCATDVTLICGTLSCEARTQGYWHRQCMGAHPDWTPEEIAAILEEVTRRLTPLGIDACDALAKDNPSDPCERAMMQTAAVLANMASGLLGPGCEVDLGGIDPDAPATAGALADYLIQLILAGECKRANDLADAVNTQAAIVDAQATLLMATEGPQLVFGISSTPEARFDLFRSPDRQSLGTKIMEWLEAGVHVTNDWRSGDTVYYRLHPTAPPVREDAGGGSIALPGLGADGLAGTP